MAVDCAVDLAVDLTADLAVDLTADLAVGGARRAHTSADVPSRYAKFECGVCVIAVSFTLAIKLAANSVYLHANL